MKTKKAVTKPNLVPVTNKRAAARQTRGTIIVLSDKECAGSQQAPATSAAITDDIESKPAVGIIDGIVAVSIESLTSGFVDPTAPEGESTVEEIAASCAFNIARHIECNESEFLRFEWLLKAAALEMLIDMEPRSLLNRFMEKRNHMYTRLVQSAVYDQHFRCDQLLRLAKLIDDIATSPIIPYPMKADNFVYFIGGDYSAYLRREIASFGAIDVFLMVPHVSAVRCYVKSRLLRHDWFPSYATVLGPDEPPSSEAQAWELIGQMAETPKKLTRQNVLSLFHSAKTPFRIIAAFGYPTPIAVLNEFYPEKQSHAIISNFEGEITISNDAIDVNVLDSSVRKYCSRGGLIEY